MLTNTRDGLESIKLSKRLQKEYDRLAAFFGEAGAARILRAARAAAKSTEPGRDAIVRATQKQVDIYMKRAEKIEKKSSRAVIRTEPRPLAECKRRMPTYT